MSSSVRVEDFSRDFVILGINDRQAIVGFGPFEWCDCCDPTRASFYVQDFYLSRKQSWFVPAETRTVTLRELEELSVGIAAADFTSPKRAVYEKAFAGLFKKFEKGELKKAVPVIFEEGKLTAGSGVSLIPKLASLPGMLNCFAYRAADEMIVGLSPEVLFRKEADSPLISSEAVAGTTLSQNSDKLLADPHLQLEHRMVVDDISAQFSKIGRCRTSMISLQPYPGLMHLRAELTVEPHSHVNPEELVSLLHPTGALGVLPRGTLASDSLRELDPMQARGLYGAPLGVVLPNGFWKFVVMIRCVMLSGDRVRIGSGGGIISSSKITDEWAELANKRKSVKQTFFGTEAKRTDASDFSSRRDSLVVN